MKEAVVEARLQKLRSYGFDVYKLRTPGRAGVMDRLILRPKYAPGPPVFVELKRPGKSEEALQAAVRDDWRARGVDVRDMCDTVEKVDALTDALAREVANWHFLRRVPGCDCQLCRDYSLVQNA